MNNLNIKKMARIESAIIGAILVIVFSLVFKNCNAQDYIITTKNDSIKCYIQGQDEQYTFYKMQKADESSLRLNNKDVKRIFYGPKNDLQYKVGRPVYNPTHHFCEIIVIGSLDSIISVKLSAGKEVSNYQLAPELFDASGKYRTFTTFVDALNFMDALGYKPNENYIISLGKYYEYHYIMYTGLRQ